MYTLTAKDFFFCYDFDISKKLQSNGFRYICVGYNAKSNGTFHQFFKTPDLVEVLNSLLPMRQKGM